jgi:hypothetical protein
MRSSFGSRRREGDSISQYVNPAKIVNYLLMLCRKRGSPYPADFRCTNGLNGCIFGYMMGYHYYYGGVQAVQWYALGEPAFFLHR